MGNFTERPGNGHSREINRYVSRVYDEARLLWFSAHTAAQQARETCEALRVEIDEMAKDEEFRNRYHDAMLARILEAAIVNSHADMGNIQLVDANSGQLTIHVHRGFHLPFLDFFNSVEAGEAACGQALKTASRTVVEDVANSKIFADSSALEVMLEAKARAVQSTPLFGSAGQVLGILSTHYQMPWCPNAKDLRKIDYLASFASGLIEWRKEEPTHDSMKESVKVQNRRHARFLAGSPLWERGIRLQGD